MPDNLLLTVFGTLAGLSFAFGALCLFFAVRQARKKDGELAMGLWSIAALAGFSFGGMCLAYFVIPIVLNRL